MTQENKEKSSINTEMEEIILNEEKAFQAIDEVLSIPQDPETEPSENDYVLNNHQKMLLDCKMPFDVHQTGFDNNVYVPAQFIDHAARNIFGDTWETEIINQSIIYAGKTSIHIPMNKRRNSVERSIFRVISQATVKVTVKNKNGNKQSHTGMGICNADIPFETGDIALAYKTAIKGSVTDARRTALRLFGRIFTTSNIDRDEVLESLIQRRKIIETASEEKKAPEEIPDPLKAVSKRAGAKQTTVQTPEKAKFPLFDKENKKINEFNKPNEFLTQYYDEILNIAGQNPFIQKDIDQIKTNNNTAFVACKALNNKDTNELIKNIETLFDDIDINNANFDLGEDFTSSELEEDDGQIAPPPTEEIYEENSFIENEEDEVTEEKSDEIIEEKSDKTSKKSSKLTLEEIGVNPKTKKITSSFKTRILHLLEEAKTLKEFEEINKFIEPYLKQLKPKDILAIAEKNAELKKNF